MKAILVDDEPLAINVLENVLRGIEHIEIVGTFTSAKVAFREMENVRVDVVFLDMEMGDIHGLQFAEEIVMRFPHVEVVFVTAYSEYALKAFEVSAVDYLLKPVKRERLQKTIDKMQKRFDTYKQNSQSLKAEEIQLVARVMGSFQLVWSGKNVVKWRTKKVKELFVYLWHHREAAIHRTRIIEELWADLPIEKATTLLHTTVYQLRKGLKALGVENPISMINEKYALNFSVQSDSSELEQILHKREMTRAAIEKAIGLYQGDYLEEESYPWALHAQQRIKQAYLQYLEAYIHKVKNNREQSSSIEICLDQMIQMDPYNEDYICLFIEHYGEVRKIEKMIIRYHEFKKRWIEELGIDIPKAIIDIYTKHISK
ncbi:response regulator [Sporosarcina sp. ACRSM]|uniref:response regulator n=1 Tax=Sporosarcina sp. ACRSM TaxID=2918216 RepID=UPI001EF610FF|nr:response regulator [Sporosarcina sp. ACRSM]MCG7336507.1 response regulator [Sporosarcina sp. ACRSM]